MEYGYIIRKYPVHSRYYFDALLGEGRAAFDLELILPQNWNKNFLHILLSALKIGLNRVKEASCFN